MAVIRAAIAKFSMLAQILSKKISEYFYLIVTD